MLSLENINITLGTGTKLERQVLNNLSLTVAKGEFVVIIGGNGAGKSTILNIISGLLQADAGKIIIDGHDVTKTSQVTRAKVVSKVMQDPKTGTMENMTILENMAFAYKRGLMRGLLPFTSSARTQLFKEKLAMLNMGLENRLFDLVANLSGGQRQALSLIMAILADARILLLDEITAALDPKTAAHIMQITNKIIRQERRTCIMITHNIAHTIEYGDRSLLLQDGKFIREFTGHEKQQLTPELLHALYI